MLMLGSELRLPNQLQHQPLLNESNSQHGIVIEIKERLERAHKALKQEQLKVRQDDQEKPLLFAPGDMMWLQN